MSFERLAPSQSWEKNTTREGPTAQFGASAIDALCRNMSQKTVRSGDLISASDCLTESAIVVRSGIAALVHAFQDGRRQVLELLFPGDLMICDATDPNETCLLHAATDVTVCEIDCDTLFDLGLERTDIGRPLLDILRGIVLRKNRQLLDLGRKSAAERVASFLIAYEQRYTGPANGNGSIRLQVPRGIIADFLCLTRETISRNLAQFRDEGLIRLLRHDELEIVDAAGLRRRGSGEDAAVRV